VAGIVEQNEVMSLSHLTEGVIAAGLSHVVDADDRLCVRTNFLLYAVGIEQEGIGINIREDGRSALKCHAIGGGCERHGRDNHLIARPYVDRVHRRVKSRGSIAYGHCLFRPYEVGKCLFEGVHLRSGRQPIGTQGLRDRLHIVLLNGLPSIGQGVLSHRLPAIHRQC
jgi:hypothetical protein